MLLTPAAASVHEEKCSRRLGSSPGGPAQEQAKGEIWPGEQPYSPMLKSMLASPGALHGSLGEKPATADPSRPAFKSTWNGTAEANLFLTNLLLHILKRPFMFGGVRCKEQV